MHLDQSFVIRLVNNGKFHSGTWIFDDNSVCIATFQQNDTKIQHYDSKGLINQFISDQDAYQTTIAPINQYEMILLQKNAKRIEYLNILTKQRRFIQYNFRSIGIFNHNIISFPKTNLFCVVQNLKQNEQHKIMISYLDKNLNIVSEYLFDNTNRLLKPKTLNLSSQLVIFNTIQTDIIKIEIIDSTQKYTFEGAFPTPGRYRIKEIFELSPKKLILNCQSQNPHKLIEWNLEKNIMKSLTIEGIKQDKIFQIYFGGDYLYFLMLADQQNKHNLFVVDQNTLEIVHHNDGFIDNYHQYKVQINKGRSRLVQIQTHRDNFTTVGIRTLEMVNQKELFLNILEQIGGFDEEMLRSIVCAVQYKIE